MGRTKTDKIFDNKFTESAPGYDSSISFKPAETEEIDLEDQVHYNILYNDIDRLIKESKEFKNLIILDKDNKLKKLSKIQMNDIYIYVINNIKTQYRKMEVFDILTDYFDIFPTKYYNALSNTFKDELCAELNISDDIIEKKNLKDLY